MRHPTTTPGGLFLPTADQIERRYRGPVTRSTIAALLRIAARSVARSDPERASNAGSRTVTRDARASQRYEG